MAGKVNTKFVIGLSVALVALAGAAGAAGVFFYQRTASNLAKQGDRLFALYEDRLKAGDAADAQKRLKLAITAYSKAVNKEDTNSVYLRKWEKALTQLTPPEGAEFEKAFMDYLALKRRLATLAQTDPRLHMDYLDVLYENMLRFPGNKGVSERLASETGELLKFFKNDPKGDVLRRYRGLATLEQFIATPELDAKRVEQGRQDLEAACAADPKDEVATEGLVRWHELLAERARAESRREDADAEAATALGLAEAFLAANPDAPRLLVARFRIEAQKAQQKVPVSNDRKKAQEAFNAFRDSLRPRLDALTDALLASSGSKITARVIDRFDAIEEFIEGNVRLARTERLIGHALKSQPDDAPLLLASADLLAKRGELDGAIVAASRVIELPRLPVGIPAAQQFIAQNAARYQRCLWASDAWERAQGAEAKGKALERLKSFRDQLATSIDPGSVPLLLVNAQVAYAEGNLPLAARSLRDFNEKTRNTSVEGLWLEAQVARQQAKPGLARERLQQLVAIRPTVPAIVSLIDIELSTGRRDAALQMLDAVEGNLPDTPEVKAAIARVRAEETGAKTGDPTFDIPLEAFRLAQSDQKKVPEAIRMLQDAAKTYKQHERIVNTLVRLQLASGDEKGAIESLEAGAAANPDNRAFDALLKGLKAPQGMERELAINDGVYAAPEAAIEKGLGRFTIFQRHGKDAECRSELDALAKLAPNDTRVLELRFIRALDAKEFDAASKLADEAARVDADGAEGLTFRARLQQARGQLREAIATLEQVVTRGAPNPEMWRLLGRFRLEAGRTADAVTAFERALQLRETDVASIRDLVSALAYAGRTDEALARARASRGAALNDEQFVSMWLTLEAEAGDHATALQGRRGIARVRPDDRANSLALASLLIQERQLDEARQLLDKLKASSNALDLCAIDAAWHEASGDLAGAKKVYEDFIKDQGPDKVTVQAFLAFARYLARRGDVDGMLAALEQGRAKQDPKTMEADGALAEAFFRLGRDQQGIEAAKRVIAGGADTDRFYQKMIVSTMIRRGDFAGAETELAGLKSVEATDPGILIMRSQAAAGKKDSRAAMKLADEAVTRFPEFPGAYVHRARLFAASATTQRDAVADMNKAVSLDKASAALLLERANLHERLGNDDQAVKDRRDAVVLAPGDARLRRQVLSDLLIARRFDDAVETAEQVFANSRSSPSVGLDLGSTFAQFGQWPRAMRFYRAAYEAQKDPSIAAAYINGLLNQTPPDTGTAGTVLREMGDKARTEYNLAIARARWLWIQGERNDSFKAATDSLRARDTTRPDLMTNWFAVLKDFVRDPKDYLPYLEATEKAGVAVHWARYFRATTLFEDPAQRAKGVEILRELTSAASPGAVRQLSYRQLSAGLYEMGRYNDVVTIAREGLETFHDDANLLNNLAYTLAQNMDKPDEALPMAEKAAQLGGTAEALDTLGFIQLRLKRLSDARSTLNRAIDMPQAPGSLMSTLNHFIAVCLEQGDKEAAAKAVEQADALLAGPSGAQIPKDAKDEYQTLKTKVQ